LTPLGCPIGSPPHLLGAEQDYLVSVVVTRNGVGVIVRKVAQVGHLANPLVKRGERDEPCPNGVVGSHPQGRLDRADY